MKRALGICAGLIINVSASETAITENLDLYGTGQLTRIALAYPYLPIEYEKNLQQTKLYLCQGLWTYTLPNTVILTGSLSPCIALIAKYKEDGQEAKALVAHVDYLADISSLYEPIFQLAAKSDFTPSALTIDLFTASCDSYDDLIPEYDGHTWKTLHGGRSQIEQLKVIKDSLCSHFNLERTSVRARKFDPFKQIQSYGRYICVGSQLAITSNGNVYMVSHYKYDPFLVRKDYLLTIVPNDFYANEIAKLKTMAMIATFLRLNNEQRKQLYSSYDNLYGVVPMISCIEFITRHDHHQRVQEAKSSKCS